MTFKDRLKLIRKAFTRKTTELQRQIDALRNAHILLLKKIKDDFELVNDNFHKVEARLDALEGKDPEKPSTKKLRNVDDLMDMIIAGDRGETYRLACTLYGPEDGAALKEHAAQPIQKYIIEHSDAVRHPDWGDIGHWDAIYIPELDIIVDWIQGASLGGRIIDKLNWHIDEWYEEQKVK